jgi:hypothetical protein
MARIPQYEQAQLASSVVGTPGVDTSATQMFNTISGAAGEVAQQAQYALAAQRQEQLRAQRALAATEKELRDAQLESKIGALVNSKQVDFNNFDNQLREAGQWDTTGTADRLSKQLSTDVQNTLAGIEDPLERAKTEKALNAAVAGTLKSHSDWATGRAGPIVKANAKSMADSLAVKMGTAPADPTDFNAWFGDDALKKPLEDFQVSAGGTYLKSEGAAAPAAIRAAQSEGLKQRLSAFVLTQRPSADELNQALKTIENLNVIDPGDLNSFSNTQRNIAAQEHQAKMAEQTAQAKLHDISFSVDASKILNSGGTPSAAQVESFRASPSYQNATPAAKAKFEVQVNKLNNPDKKAAADARATAQQTKAQKEAARLIAEQNDAARLQVVAADAPRLDALSMSILNNKNKYDETKNKKYLTAMQEDLEKYQTLRGNIDLIANPQSVATSKYKANFGTLSAAVDLADARIKQVLKYGVGGAEAKQEKQRKVSFDSAWQVSNPYDIKTNPTRYALWNRYFIQARDYAYFNSKPAYLERVLSGEKAPDGTVTVGRRDATRARVKAMADVEKAMAAVSKAKNKGSK